MIRWGCVAARTCHKQIGRAELRLCPILPVSQVSEAERNQAVATRSQNFAALVLAGSLGGRGSTALPTIIEIKNGGLLPVRRLNFAREFIPCPACRRRRRRTHVAAPRGLRRACARRGFF